MFSCAAAKSRSSSRGHAAIPSSVCHASSAFSASRLSGGTSSKGSSAGTDGGGGGGFLGGRLLGRRSVDIGTDTAARCARLSPGGAGTGSMLRSVAWMVSSTRIAMLLWQTAGSAGGDDMARWRSDCARVGGKLIGLEGTDGCAMNDYDFLEM